MGEGGGGRGAAGGGGGVGGASAGRGGRVEQVMGAADLGRQKGHEGDGDL